VKLKDSQPICLVGGVFKVIFEVLANQLKTMLEKIVSKSQNAYIKGRQILNSILIANECIDCQLGTRFVMQVRSRKGV
jgi:hypothetical protein